MEMIKKDWYSLKEETKKLITDINDDAIVSITKKNEEYALSAIEKGFIEKTEENFLIKTTKFEDLKKTNVRNRCLKLLKKNYKDGMIQKSEYLFQLKTLKERINEMIGEADEIELLINNCNHSYLANSANLDFDILNNKEYVWIGYCINCGKMKVDRTNEELPRPKGFSNIKINTSNQIY